MTGGPASDDQEFIIKKIAMWLGSGDLDGISPTLRVTMDASGAVALAVPDSRLKRNLSLGPCGGRGGL